MKKVRDHFFHQAKRDGYAARAVYKLEEIQRKHRLLKPGMRVLDLGCAPGSWLQYAVQQVAPAGRVTGMDLLPPPPGVKENLASGSEWIEGDIFETEAEELLNGGPPFAAILSDMAPNTTGVRSADAARSAELVLRVLDLADTLLAPGGSLLVKVFQGGRLPELRQEFSRRFGDVTLEKPKASRKESVEVFLLGRGRKDR